VQIKSDLAWLLSRFSSSKHLVVVGFLAVSLGGVAVTIDPLLMRTLIDSALPQKNFAWALRLVGMIGLCYLGRSVLYGIGTMVTFSISQQCVRDLRVAILEQMNRLSADYHEQTPTGEKLIHIERDVDEIANLGADATNQCVRAALFFLLNLAMMARLNIFMTLTVLPLLPVFVIIQRRFTGLLRLRSAAVRFEIGSSSSFIAEHLASVPQIQLLGAEEVSEQRATSGWNRMFEAQLVQRKTQLGFSMAVSTILVATIVLALGCGSRKVLSGALTIGGLVAFYAYVTRIFDPIGSAMDFYSRLQTVQTSINRVRGLLNLEPSVRDEGSLTINEDGLKLGLVIENVSFSYMRNPVLENLTLHVAPGEHIAIIGTTGSGKSTLARLLVRTADPTKGHIFLEGNRLPDYTLASLRSAVCYVPQHPNLFNGSIRDNLLYANPTANSDELHRVMEAAQLLPVVERLSEGWDTPLGPGAISLSGGERQRLAIARSLLRNSAILILDESTSALDAATERSVLSSVAHYYAHQSLVIISHRINSLAWVDRLVLLHQGKVVEVGKHPFLYEKSSLYRSLVDASMRGETVSATG
jgi:ABC-type multidrug transport system fused ATPase/permease subunit